MSFESYDLINAKNNSLVLATTWMSMILAKINGMAESLEENESWQKQIKSTGEKRLNLQLFK